VRDIHAPKSKLSDFFCIKYVWMVTETERPRWAAMHLCRGFTNHVHKIRHNYWLQIRAASLRDQLAKESAAAAAVVREASDAN
jgi:hypothetical protein